MGKDEDTKNLLKRALEVMEKYLFKVYEEPKKYRKIMNEYEVIDNLQIISWACEGEADALYDWIHKMRRVPC